MRVRSLRKSSPESRISHDYPRTLLSSVRMLIPSSFDMFLPQDWPTDPPIVKFVLERHDSDSARSGFNPNLHPNGKGCLSMTVSP